jgi:CheY-like chemotaxis protein
MGLSERQILLVDDDDITCEMMKQWFSPGNYLVTSAQSMAEGWKLAQSNYFDLCLLDSRLPDGTGYELCQRICADIPNLPVVFYSGCAFDEDRQLGLAAGARAYLVKPNDLERIEEVISSIISEAGAV